MTVTIGSVTEGNANAEEIKNNSPDSELYEKNKKYLLLLCFSITMLAYYCRVLLRLKNAI